MQKCHLLYITSLKRNWCSIPLGNSVADGKRSGVSGPIRSIKMYSYAQCTMQERSVYQCVVEMYPVWPIWSRDLAPSTLSTCPSPYLPGYWGLSLLVALNKDGPGQWSGHLQAAQPRTCGPGKCMLILFFISVQKCCLLECLSNDYLPSTDCCYIFRFD
jgi:hypothetical protein